MGGYILKQKYRVYTKFEQGLSRQISGLAKLQLPTELGKPTVANIGLTGGQESLHWYWFFGAVYGVKSGTKNGVDDHNHQNSGNHTISPGNHLIYNATLGYRPIKTQYSKPDIVFFLEGMGKYQRKATKKGDIVSESGGHNWSLAPTFMLTYRNIALRGGMEFGIGNSGELAKKSTNYKLILEWHL
ncbi:MAG: hypothetical protein ABEH43_05595 [Flavobacteriales bacterium]